MGKKKLGDPLYTDEPEEHYLVVVNPWGMVTGRQRKQRDIDCCGTWLRAIFGLEPGLIETIYVMDTREEVIVRLAPEADHELGLGLHDPRNFLTEQYLKSIMDRTVIRGWKDIFRVEYLTALTPLAVISPSYIFEYNWSRHGDPARHQWKEFFPTPHCPPAKFPVKLPYPEASWTPFPPQCSDQRLSSMIIPLRPKSESEHTKDVVMPMGLRELHESKFKVDNQENKVSLFKLGKLDPYERERKDKRLIRDNLGPIKNEETDDAKPSVALIDAYNEYQKHQGSSRQTSDSYSIKEERDIKPAASQLSQDDDAPSDVLRSVYDEYIRSTGSSLGRTSSHQGEPQKRKVKKEHDDTRHPYGKRVKCEPPSYP